MHHSWRLKLLIYTLLVITVFTILIPLVYVGVTSLKSSEDIFRGSSWLPKPVSLQSWVEALTSLNILRNMRNSLLSGLGAMILALIILVPGAYVFARKNFPGKEFLFYMVTATLLFPVILLVVPITEIMVNVGLFNTYPGLWLAFQTLIIPFGLWTMRGYFAGLPMDLEEAAMVYGCTEFQAFYKVILPISMPAIIAVSFISFLIGWNDFEFSNMLVTTEGIKPATVALYTYTISGEQISWGPLMAMTILIGVPPMVLYMLAQRFIIKGFGER